MQDKIKYEKQQTYEFCVDRVSKKETFSRLDASHTPENYFSNRLIAFQLPVSGSCKVNVIDFRQVVARSHGENSYQAFVRAGKGMREEKKDI